MEVIEFPDKMDVLLGKVGIAYLACVNINKDDLRVVQAINLITGLVKPPAIVHSVSPLDYFWPKVFELLERGEVGLVVSADVARQLYQETGRKVNYIILYGSEGFWNIVAERAERYGMDRQRFRAFVEMFGRHMAALRFFWKHGLGILPDIRDYASGKTDREWLARQLVNMLLDVYAYEVYPIPEAWKDYTLLAKYSMNKKLLELVGDPVVLLELDKPLKFQVKAEFEREEDAEEIYKILYSLHPRAVERKNQHTVVAKLLF